MHATHLRATLAALAAVAFLGAPAEAQWRDSRGAAAHNQGYRDGARAGGDDARDGRASEYQRHRDYRQADSGYQSPDGGKDDHRQQYRAGFIAGYRDGYNAGGGRGPAVVYPRPGPSRNGPAYGSGGPPYGRGRPSGRASTGGIAAANGFEDGYRKGLDDGRDGDRYDVRRHSRYGKGDHGYRRELGLKRHYQQAYRAAFERGYDEGYRDGRDGRWRR